MEYYTRVGTKGGSYSYNKKGCKYIPINAAKYVVPVNITSGKRIPGLVLYGSSPGHVRVYERDVIKGYQEHFLENSNIKIWEF